MFKIGLNTWLWADLFSEKDIYCIGKAYELGAEALDISINNPYSFPTEKVVEEISHCKGMEIITSTAMPIDCNAISTSVQERENALNYMKRLIDVSAQLGSRIIGGVNYAASGYHSGKLRTEQEVEWCVKYLRQAAEYAAEYSISIALEPVKRFETHFLNTAEQALELIQYAESPNLKIQLDTFHMNIEEADLSQAIESCGDKLIHMHLVDNNRGVPGMGHIPWLDVLRSLKKIGYEGAGCIETFNPTTLERTCSATYLTRKFADSPEELAEKGLAYLKAARTMIYSEQK
jgi:D-psicose/D-tagatose/L-ribulose 3-epimerase